MFFFFYYLYVDHICILFVDVLRFGITEMNHDQAKFSKLYTYKQSIFFMI